MHVSFKLGLIALALTATSAQALTLDYRHEFKADSEKQANRLKLGHTTESGLFVGVEGKMTEGESVRDDGFKTGNGNWSGSGSEWELGQNFTVTDKLIVAPAVNIDVGDTFVGYRIQLKGIYSITDNWVTTLRWRGGIQKDEDSNNQNKNYNQINWEFGYKNENFSIIGDYEYKFTNYDDYKGKHNNWLYNVVITVPVNNQWVPYGEIGYVPRYHSSDDSQDEMEMRYRIGIKYNL
ncbi:oligogalacturonate-specific porin KdgM family protein [Aeromonas media]|uniref:oligogalacturonate-specific porin KdgM family protein n=1 Tax=Aeromonas media TaxID=651 RepID=UPI00227E43D6|nr:oligogalacturonate-specific porin KdgM family protein [Aeromonas media]MCY9838151.1 hypothetical protein [Aeromonas media]